MDEKNKTKNFTIRQMTQDLHHQLKARAAERGIPLYNLIIEYLVDAMKRDKGGKS